MGKRQSDGSGIPYFGEPADVGREMTEDDRERIALAVCRALLASVPSNQNEDYQSGWYDVTMVIDLAITGQGWGMHPDDWIEHLEDRSKPRKHTVDAVARFKRQGRLDPTD